MPPTEPSPEREPLSIERYLDAAHGIDWWRYLVLADYDARERIGYTVAEVGWRLAERMVNHAACGSHPVVTEGCPFCDDIAAYREYREMGGTVSEHVWNGERISLSDIRKQGPSDG